MDVSIMNIPQLAIKLRTFFGFSPRILFKSAIPIISCSTGNMGNNGALTAITALPTTYSGGAWVNLPAGAIAAGVPAVQTSYWCVFSTSQAGTVYNNTQPATGYPTPPTAAQLVPFVTTGPGAFTGITAATALLTVPIPGGSIGANGQMRITYWGSYTNSGGTKLQAVLLGASQLFATTGTTQVANYWTSITSNINAQNLNKTVFIEASTTGAPTYTSEDLSVTKNLVFRVTNNTATDNFVLEDVLIELLSDGS